MTRLEQQASKDNYQSVWLQVLAMNKDAHHLYQPLGYTVAWASPQCQQMLIWPSYLLCKTLLPASLGAMTEQKHTSLLR